PRSAGPVTTAASLSGTINLAGAPFSAAVTGDLEHPNIVPVYDLGQAPDGSYFYAMKHVRGTPWDKTIRDTTQPQNIEYLLRVCDAMAFAHSKGIIHRDLKPENTMIGDYGEVMVMDWGLAIPTDRRQIAGIALGEIMAGTPSYMAPEMACGPFRNITTRSDIYLLGAILFEIVTGKPPHTGDSSRACMINAAQNKIRDVEVRGELHEIALKAMATEPEDRYQSVQEFQDAIRTYQSHSESIALSTLATESLETAGESGDYEDYSRSVFGYQQALDLWSENRTASTGLIESKFRYAKAACDRGDYDLGAGLLDLSGSEHQTLHEEIEVRRQERERRQHRAKLYRQLGLALAGVLFLVVSGAAVWINSARSEAVQQRSLAEVARQDAEKKRQEAEDAGKSEKKQREIAEEKQRVAEQAKEQEALARERAEQERIAAEKARKDAEAAKAKEIEQKELAESRRQEAEEQRQRADEQRVLADEQRAIAVDKQREATEARQNEAYEAYVARIAAAASRIDANAYLNALELLRDCIPAQGEADYRNWEWGRMLYLCQQSTQVLPTKASLETIAAADSDRGLGLFAVAGDSSDITLWAPQSNFQKNIRVETDQINCLAFSPSNRSLAVGTSTPGAYLQVVNLQTGNVSTLGDDAAGAHEQPVLSVEYSRDGRQLLTASLSGKIKIWDLASRRPTTTLQRHRGAVQQAIFFPSANGRPQTKILSVSHDGTAIIWQDDSGRWASAAEVDVKGIFREHRGPVFSAAISKDGEKIATAGLSGRILIWSDAELSKIDLVELIERKDAEDSATNYIELVGHTAAVRSLDFAEATDLLVSAGHDNTVRVWDPNEGKLIKVLRGHGRWVRGCVVSNDGRRVVSAGYDGAARLWDIEGYEELRVLRGKVLDGHDDGIMAAEFSHNSKRIVTASRDRTVRTWDFATGEQTGRFREGHKFLASHAVTFANGKYLATAAGDESVRIWDVESGAEVRTLANTGRGAAMDVSRDGRFILTGGPVDPEEARKTQTEDALKPWSARLFDVTTGRQILQLLGHRALVSAVAISPDNRLLYTGDINGTGVVWDRQTGKLLRRLAWHQSKVLRAAFSADGSTLMTASLERGIAVWDLSTWEVVRERILMHPSDLISTDFDRDGTRVVTSCEDGKVRVWDTRTSKVIRTLEMGDATDRSVVDRVSISPSGDSVLTLSRQTGAVRMFQVASGAEVRFRQAGGQTGGVLSDADGSRLSAVVFAGDDEVVSVGGDQVRLWDTNPQLPQYRRLRMNFSPHAGVASASFSSDSSEIISGSWDGTANIWDADSGAVRIKLVGRHSGPVHCATFSPDPASQRVATAGADRTIVIWDAASGDFIKRLMGHEEAVNWVAFSPDSRRLVSASNDKTVRVWEIESGKQLLVYRHDSPVLRTTFSPKGDRIAAATVGNMAYIWSANDAAGQDKPLFELSGHTAAVTSIAFSPDGQRAITGSDDFTAKVWDVSERGPKELVALTGHQRAVTSVAFSPDRLNVLTASEDGTAIIWMAGTWQQASRDELQVTQSLDRVTPLSRQESFAPRDFRPRQLVIQR
ncbi:MAG: protein kinase, partial [Planctomycetota bacterium]